MALVKPFGGDLFFPIKMVYMRIKKVLGKSFDWIRRQLFLISFYLGKGHSSLCLLENTLDNWMDHFIFTVSSEI